MFEPSDKPRVFALPSGVDFPAALVSGLIEQFAGQPPQVLAKVELIVNTRRMARRIRALFDDGPALLLPRIRLVTDLGEEVGLDHIPPAVPPLQRRLELVQLVSAFLDANDKFAPRSALFDLADSLAALLGEMQGEGVSPEVIARLEVDDQSGHWSRTKDFLAIVQQYCETSHAAPDGEARQRRIVETLTTNWQTNPPDHPVIIAGSTGSRGATQLLMQAVAKLPQGALVLPGFDFDMPGELWAVLDDPLLAEDHPQYRFHALMRALNLGRNDILQWGTTTPPNPARNALVSLALRPAPVTDQWLRDGPYLTDLDKATQDITLVEAPGARHEALAIALRLRQAAEDGKTAALITPDRMLTRRVAAALDRWNILPDDSAGEPLALSPIGRLMRHVVGLFQDRLTAESLLTLLKHPLTHSAEGRGNHLRLTRDLELHLRKKGPPYPDADMIRAWGATHECEAWADWVAETCTGQVSDGDLLFETRLNAHIDLTHLVIRGSDATATAHPWDHADGHAAKQIVDALIDAAPAGGPLSAFDYANLFGAVLSGGEVREVETPHPDILIWGTLEARVQGADLLILAGLNEGSWPEAPTPDPWLNRKMRHDAGLLLPERRIGLSAHDFQQAIAAKEVWLTRSTKSDEAETVVSRWLNRLINLLGGLTDQGGKTALDGMRSRGKRWLALAKAMEDVEPNDPAFRPAPRPPVTARPRKLSVTEIQKLIRDPYAIYARHVLRLRPLDPLMRTPDALARGIVTHDVMERFIKSSMTVNGELSRDALMTAAREVIEAEIPWPAARLMWLSRLDRVADSFLADEHRRRESAEPIAFEVSGKRDMTAPDFTLTCQADRIDRTATGGLRIYDYKTGTPPSKDKQKHFDKQLLLETVIAENGGFKSIDASVIEAAAYIGIGASPGEVSAPITEEPPEKIWTEFRALIASYLSDEQGFQSRRAMFESRDVGDYDQLARFGEWDITDEAISEVLT
ncbi:double-strand break repair protein AddB [Alisedimentitalea sp. MJ-SS2]|uniref:double-strand break repair protein AddB n=1 Tax=Aliisedimentitalea sp. MJ-SS2 TaxID=3049795 RepID=UPI002914F052|nr:double-strand break repair protein AddB [Alisedimentitalea sp. MJ-SS2]MDU8927950.1 double-strand break repair protein AddB [Alisedimentitalea sp. MJ-SS2]